MLTQELLHRDPRKVAGEIVETARQDPGWLDAFAVALERERSHDQLGRTLAVWGLSQSEAARLFGVSRQAVSKWLASGVPTDRVGAVADLAAATDLLIRYAKRDRIPAVVRRGAVGLQGHSLVDLVAAGETRKALETCRAMFAFNRVHV